MDSLYNIYNNKSFLESYWLDLYSIEFTTFPFGFLLRIPVILLLIRCPV